MRKLLLASTALAGVALVAGGAAADEAPINVTLGGSVEFQAGFTDNDDATVLGSATTRERDFQNKFTLNVDAAGKSGRLGGVEYGGRVQLWNGYDQYNTVAFTGGGNDVDVNEAFVYLSGSWGKVSMGDTYGASDMFMFAPVVGVGQVDGDYTEFLSPGAVQAFAPSYVNDLETSTKIYYQTPDFHGFRVGASYTPNFYDSGANVVKFGGASAVGNSGAANSFYENFVEATAAYNAAYESVNVGLAATLVTADGNPTSAIAARNFTGYGIGAQVGYGGFTVGGSWYDPGRYNTTTGQDRDQSVWTAGVTYEVDAIEAGFSYLSGEGYTTAGTLAGAGVVNNASFISDYQAFSFGAVYTWFPGMSTAFDATFFDQEHQTTATLNNEGHVIIVSQKFAF